MNVTFFMWCNWRVVWTMGEQRVKPCVARAAGGPVRRAGSLAVLMEPRQGTHCPLATQHAAFKYSIEHQSYLGAQQSVLRAIWGSGTSEP